jgi:hypothetical protein
MIIQNKTIMNKYEFFGLRFVPGYNDWDVDYVTIEAETEELAVKEFRKLKWITKGWSVEKLEN